MSEFGLGLSWEDILAQEGLGDLDEEIKSNVHNKVGRVHIGVGREATARAEGGSSLEDFEEDELRDSRDLGNFLGGQ